MKSYEELLMIVGAARLERVEEALQMLTPADAGRSAYKAIMARYSRFSATGDQAAFEAVAAALSRITGSKF